MPGDAPVLVAGAGPVGLTAAHELARRGVAVRLVDQAAGPAESSRAIAVHARTLEICAQMGLLDRLLPRGRRVEHFSIHRLGRLLIRFDTNYDDTPTAYPFSLMVDQVITERVLRERLRELGVEVEWGVALEGFTQHTGEVSVTLRHAGGRVEEAVVPWLLGTDGAHSTVRRQLGLRLRGEAIRTWLNADVVLDAPLPADSNHLLHTGDGTLLLVPFPEDGKWRVVDTAGRAVAEDPELVRNRLAAKLSRALGRPVEVATPTWLSLFTVQQRMIERMRVGRCFVAGDAAHVHSPASGQGMNAGMHDAYNLAWKLAAVVTGQAEERLLDTYDEERLPVGATLLGSTRTATALVALRNVLAPVLLPAGLGLLGLAKPVKRRVERTMIRSFSGLALSYADSSLSLPAAAGTGVPPGGRAAAVLAGTGAGPARAALREELADPRWSLLCFGEGLGPVLDHVVRTHGHAVSVRAVPGPGPRSLPDPGGVLAAGFGLRGGGYALIRPDGYLAGKGPLTGAGQIEAVLAAVRLRAAAVPGGPDADH
ncbi:FAD-dependent monooxygenase [Amycolatopsis sp. NPDC049688]|uniref:FAD-dependent monooxygenase n=1 Tax=Amycolatopsis sp. NPDC049688 TaxID=3154733 RepID=UPI00342151D8